MTGKKHFAVVSSQMDKAEKQAEKASKDIQQDGKKIEDSCVVSPSLPFPEDGDIPIFTEEFLNFNKGNDT